MTLQQKLAHITKKKILKIYEYLKTEEGAQKLKDNNYKIGTISLKFKLTKMEADLYLDEVCRVSRSHKTKAVCELIHAVKQNTSYKPSEMINFDEVLEMYKLADSQAEESEVVSLVKKENEIDTSKTGNKIKDESKDEIEKALELVEDESKTKVLEVSNKKTFLSGFSLSSTQIALSLGVFIFIGFVSYKLYVTMTNPTKQRFKSVSISKQVEKKKAIPLKQTIVKEIKKQSITKPTPTLLVENKPLPTQKNMKVSLTKPTGEISRVPLPMQKNTKIEFQENKTSKGIETPVIPVKVNPSANIKVPVISKVTPLPTKISSPNKHITSPLLLKEKNKVTISTISKISELIVSGDIKVGNDFIMYQEITYKKGDVFNGFLIKKIRSSYIKLYSLKNKISKKIRTK